MKYRVSHIYLLVILVSCLLIGCQNRTEKTSVPDLEAMIGKHIDSFYTTYKKYNYEWIDFFEDEFVNVFPDTPIRNISKDSTKALWKGIYTRYHVQIVSYGKPSFITSQDMVISHNNFHEIFINKQTQDTIKNIGAYIIAWRKQPNSAWKIAFETVQNN